LVRNERKGYWIPYEINPTALEKCGEFLSSVCTCGCKGTGKLRETELNNAKVALLEKYEKELREELNKVKTQIEEVKKEP
jgi:malate/lactate dehydrogenase